MQKVMCVYIMTNTNNSTLYTGVTSDLLRRVSEHKRKSGDRFTKRYNLTKLVYYEVVDDLQPALAREKQIKQWSRARKEKLIEEMNPGWLDLGDRILAQENGMEPP